MELMRTGSERSSRRLGSRSQTHLNVPTQRSVRPRSGGSQAVGTVKYFKDVHSRANTGEHLVNTQGVPGYLPENYLDNQVIHPSAP